MDILLIALIVLGFFHYYMEGFVIPILRNEMKMKLTSLHDKVSALKETYRTPLQKKVIEQFSDSIITTIVIIPNHNLYHFLAMPINDVDNDRVQQRINDFANCNIPEIKEYRMSYLLYVRKLFIINGAGNILRMIIIAIISLSNAIRRAVKLNEKRLNNKVLKNYENSVKELKNNKALQSEIQKYNHQLC